MGNISKGKPASVSKLGIIREAFAFPFMNVLSVTRISLMPWLITEVLYVTLSEFFPQLTWPLFPQLVMSRHSSGDVDPFELIPDLIRAPITIIYYAFFAILAVGIHRMIILHERPGWLIYRFGRYELAYAVTFFLVSALIWVPILVFGQAVASFRSLGLYWLWSGYVVYMLIWTVLAIKLLLIYPHAAVTGRISFPTAWAAMKGNFWHSLGVLIISYLLAACILLPLMLIAAPLYLEHVQEDDWIVTLWDAGWTVLNIVVFAVAVALVSLLYRDIMAKYNERKTPDG